MSVSKVGVEDHFAGTDHCEGAAEDGVDIRIAGVASKELLKVDLGVAEADAEARPLIRCSDRSNARADRRNATNHRITDACCRFAVDAVEAATDIQAAKLPAGRNTVDVTGTEGVRAGRTAGARAKVLAESVSRVDSQTAKAGRLVGKRVVKTNRTLREKRGNRRAGRGCPVVVVAILGEVSRIQCPENRGVLTTGGHLTPARRKTDESLTVPPLVVGGVVSARRPGTRGVAVGNVETMLKCEDGSHAAAEIFRTANTETRTHADAAAHREARRAGRLGHGGRLRCGRLNGTGGLVDSKAGGRCRGDCVAAVGVAVTPIHRHVNNAVHRERRLGLREPGQRGCDCNCEKRFFHWSIS